MFFNSKSLGRSTGCFSANIPSIKSTKHKNIVFSFIKCAHCFCRHIPALCTISSGTTLRRRIQHFILNPHHPGITTLIVTLQIIVTTIAFLARLHDFITAEGALWFRETIAFLVLLDCVQHVGDVADTARGKFTIIGSVTTGGRCEHYEVAIETTRTTFWRVVMLEKKSR